MRRFQLSGVAFIVLIVALGWMAATGILSILALNAGFGFLLTIVILVLFAGMMMFGKWTRVERNRLIAIFVLFAAASLFWSIYEQAGSTLNLFAERNTDRTMPGMSGPFPAGWFQSVPALMVIALAPVFAWIWVKLGSRNPSSPAKFTAALLFGGLSLVILIPIGAKTGVSPMWLVVTYLLQTIGELCLSPVGMSAMTKLAPARVASLMMGVWFVSISVGDYISGRLASLYESMPLPQLFGSVGAVALVLGIVLAVFTKPLKNLMGGAEL
jgi:POT family proton-dependent oligopeptide transporter